ncbi:MAG TPA: glycine betaine ABC transporter substrate-binding protein [Tepidisphaeraceae bacterium]|nr:glycine betaine ABC transporter substrate-binding protein [Tepidisphaeraceae bacterium]
MLLCSCSRRSHVVIGSKVFTESVILGDIAAQLGEKMGGDVSHHREIGGTRVVWDALVNGQIDAYPEYTGTISNEILAGQNIRGDAQIRRALAARGIEMTRPLGFNDSYALGMREDVAGKLGIRTITDLRSHPDLRFGFSNEFLDRRDGWPALRDAYQLRQKTVTGLDHELAYRAMADGSLDVTDLYSTDAEIAYYHLRVLEDDLHHFPDYQAVFLYRRDLMQRSPQIVRALQRLEGRITQGRMIEMNAQAKIRKIPESHIAAEFLADTLDVTGRPITNTLLGRLATRTWEHLELVAVSLAAAIILSIPLGVLACAFPKFGQVVLGTVAAIYTIPSLALLVFMLPLLGIGWKPAVVALFLYSLLPIVRNTHAGLTGIPGSLRESAAALGLPPFAALWRVELPLAAPTILAGVRTAAVINVGTATLGGFIGAGGYGRPILRGIDKFDVPLMLEGAIPAALLALAIEGVFGLIERAVPHRG